MTKRAYSCSLCVTSCRDMYPLKAPSLLSKQTAFLSPLDVSKRTWRCRGPGSSPFVLQAVSGSLRRVSICLHGLSIWCPGNAHRPVRPCRLQMVVNVERVPVAVRNSDGVRWEKSERCVWAWSKSSFSGGDSIKGVGPPLVHRGVKPTAVMRHTETLWYDSTEATLAFDSCGPPKKWKPLEIRLNNIH